jgi:IS30 family transposase
MPGPQPTLDRNLIRRMNEEGLSGCEIARRLGVVQQTVNRILRELHGRNRKVTYEPQLVLDLYEGGMSGSDIARQFGAPQQTINRILKTHFGRRSTNVMCADLPMDVDAINWRRKRDYEANIWHLVDLKRAGYSPRMTEMANTPETPGRRYFAVDHHSYIGSSAAMCAE